MSRFPALSSLPSARFTVAFALLLSTTPVAAVIGTGTDAEARLPYWEIAEIGLPTTFIIDPRSQVTHRAIGGREWDDDRLLDQLRQMLTPQRGQSGVSR